VDAQTGQAAGVPVWLVLPVETRDLSPAKPGFTAAPSDSQIAAANEWGADRVLSSFAQLLNLLPGTEN
jgi:hypothetical protein